MSSPDPFLILPVAVLVFLVIDLLIEVGSFWALFWNVFFWLYGIVYSAAAEVALFVLKASNAKIHDLPTPVLILISITGTTTILQSLTFKVGGKKVLDLSRYLDDYRRKVLTSSASWVNQEETRRVLNQSRRILQKINYVAGEASSESRMKAIYAEVMLFGNRKPATVQKEIAQMEELCALTGASFGSEVARRVAQTDRVWVSNFLIH